MEQYKYVKLGEYKDWCEIYKGETLIHNGSFLGIVNKTENETLLNVNYGIKECSHSVLKSINNFKIAVPKESDLIQSEYKYEPIIFDSNEFKEFVDNIYFDKELLENLPKVSRRDIINMWLLSYPNRKDYLNIAEMKKEIMNRILFFSDENYDLSHLNSIISASKFSVNKIPNSYEAIMIYMDSDEGVYEWVSLIKIETSVYLRLDEHYYVKYHE